MYFPWVGLLEQIRLADVFVHYDDVQFARGFYNRVQVKTPHGSKWMTVPLRNHHRGQRIDEVLINDETDWRRKHRELLKHVYAKATFRDEMLSIVDRVFNRPAKTLADISRSSIVALSDYFGLTRKRLFVQSSQLDVPGKSSQRLHDIVVKLGGTIYITGHGARNYLDHEMFERSGITVEYMNYRCIPYPQLHGQFTPNVTALDLIANCGAAGRDVIQSTTVHWRELIHGTS